MTMKKKAKKREKERKKERGKRGIIIISALLTLKSFCILN